MVGIVPYQPSSTRDLIVAHVDVMKPHLQRRRGALLTQASDCHTALTVLTRDAGRLPPAPTPVTPLVPLKLGVMAACPRSLGEHRPPAASVTCVCAGMCVQISSGSFPVPQLKEKDPAILSRSN